MVLKQNRGLRQKNPEKQDMLLKWGRKSGKAGPNLILKNLFNCKSTFICDLAKKPPIFREQNLKHFKKCREIEKPIMVILAVERGLIQFKIIAIQRSNSFKSIQTSNIKLSRNGSLPV